MALAPGNSRASSKRSIPGRWGGFGAKTRASRTTALAGANNDLTFTATFEQRGVVGNAITITYVDPPGNNVALSVAVAGTAITVTLATDGVSAVTSTAAQVRDAVNAHAGASALVTAANAGTDNGTGVVTAVGPLALTGGTDWTIGTAR